MKAKLQVLDQQIGTTTKDGIEYVALFGVTAREWRDANPALKGNIRDHANVHQLVCLANLESMNAHFIEQGLSQAERLKRLNELAIRQMRVLVARLSAGEVE